MNPQEQTPGRAASPLNGAAFEDSSWHAPHGAADGWIGTRELPGYRAGRIVAKLADLPTVDLQHLYFDLLLLDAQGRTAETLSGICPALRRDHPLDQRSRFVRVIAELLREAHDPVRGLAGLGPALEFMRENGVEGPQLAAAAQRVDAVCSERALVASLCRMLELSLGADEAREALRGLLTTLSRSDPLDGSAWRQRDAGLAEQVACVVRLIGRVRARRALREATDFELLPGAELFGL